MREAHAVPMSSGVWDSTAWRLALGRAAGMAPPVAVVLSAFVAVRLLVLLTVNAAAQEEGNNVHRVLLKWDAQWYKGIAENGYGFTRIHDDGRLLADYAFFPLFPWLERGVSAITGLGHDDAGLLISAVSSVVAAWGIFAVADHLYGPRVGLVATVLWAALPVGVVQSMAYTESLFTAFAAWSIYAVLTERWATAGVLACLAGLTRFTGAALVAAVAVPAAQHYLRRKRPDGSLRTHLHRDVRPMLAAVMAPLGLVGYVAWVGGQVGSTTGYFDVISGWGNSFDGGAAFALWIGELLTGPAPVTGVLVIIGVAALMGIYLLCIRQHQPLPLVVFAGLLVFLALTTSGYFGSKPRYLIPAFPLLLPIARWVAARRLWVTSTILAGMTVVAAVYGAVWLLGQGPP